MMIFRRPHALPWPSITLRSVNLCLNMCPSLCIHIPTNRLALEGAFTSDIVTANILPVIHNKTINIMNCVKVKSM